MTSILLVIASMIAAQPSITTDESIIMFQRQELYAEELLASIEEQQELSTKLIHDCTKSFVVTRAEILNRGVLIDNTQSRMYFNCRRGL